MLCAFVVHGTACTVCVCVYVICVSQCDCFSFWCVRVSVCTCGVTVRWKCCAVCSVSTGTAR